MEIFPFTSFMISIIYTIFSSSKTILGVLNDTIYITLDDIRSSFVIYKIGFVPFISSSHAGQTSSFVLMMNVTLLIRHVFSGARRTLEMMRVRATDPRPCPKCGKMYRSAHTLRTHLEDKHTVCPGYRCVLCGTVAKSRNSLHSHMSRQHRGISTKDLPVLQMPSPFDPDLASRLLAKAGIKMSAAELRARASPTAPRRSDMRLELSRGGAPSEAGSSVCGGDDPEDLTLPLSLRYGSPTPNNNTVITKVSSSSNSTSKNSSTAAAIAAKSLDTMHGNREPNMAPLHPSGHHPGPNASTIAGSSALLDTYLQYIAENSLTTIGFTPEQVAAAKIAQQMSVLDKRSLEDYPMIKRDEGRVSGVVHEDRQDTMHDRHSGLIDMAEEESSGAEEDEYSENEEPEVIVKSESTAAE